ncbi:MAG: hypothetical protein ABIH22_04145 [Candidatus Margulisiibacteriota bacterium]
MSNLTVKIFTNRNPRKINRPASKITRGKRMLASCGRLVATTSLSLLLHGGIAGTGNKFFTHRQLQSQPSALNDKQPKEPSEKKTEESPETTSKKLSEAERKLHLERFKAQKQAFIRQLLQDLHQGKRSMSMSNFMIKSEVLDRNIKSLETASGDIIDEKKIHNRYDAIMKQAKKWTGKLERTEKKIDELHHFSHYRLFRGYLKGSSGILNVLENGIYNCISSTKFVAALENDIVGSNNYGIIILDPPKDPSKGKSGHTLSWLRDADKLWQIENTNGGPPRRIPLEKGLRTPKEIFIAAYLVNNGIKVDQLPKKLARLYKRGVGIEGLPVAGISTDLPAPPDYLIPNPYFGVKDPKPIAKNTKDLYPKLFFLSHKQSVETAEIIKGARINAMAISFFQEPEKPMPGTTSISIIKIPAGIDWCDVAEKTIDYPENNYRWGGSLSYEFAIQPFATFDFLRRLRYLAAINMAKILSGSADKHFENCTPKAEYEKFVDGVEKVLREGKEFDEDQECFMSKQLLRGLSDREKARKELFKIIDKFGTIQSMGEEALSLLAIIGSPEDFDFFKGKLFDGAGEYFNRLLPIEFSSYALMNMDYEARDIANIFTSAFKNESHGVLRGLMTVQLGKLGYGMEALKLMENELLPGLEDWYDDPETKGPLGYKRWITDNISTLHPDSVTDKDIRLLKTMIEKEEDLFTKANLIAILAGEGKKAEVIEYVKKLDLSKLDDYHDRIGSWQNLVFSLGKIDSPETKEILISILDAYPELATAVADAFLRQRIYSEKAIKELKRILNNVLIDTEERQYAALLLVQMGEL